MSRLCSMDCGRVIYATNSTGVCRFCKKEGKKEPSVTKADDAILDRIGGKGSAIKVETQAQKNGRKGGFARAAKEVEKKPTWQEKMRALASALGLKPDTMIEDWCKKWYEEIHAKALVDPARQLPANAGPTANGAQV